MSPELPALQQQFAAAQTERERALVVRQVTRIVRSIDNNVTRRVAARELGISRFLVNCYLTLLNGEPATEQLWGRVDADMLPGTAVSLWGAARAAVPRSGSISACDVLAEHIARYDALPLVKDRGGGKVLRWRASKPSHRQDEATSADTAPDSAPQSEPERSLPNERAFYRELRALVRGYVRMRLTGYDDGRVAAEVSRLETDVKVLLGAFAQRVHDIKREAPLAVVLQRAQVRDACRALRMDPPRGVADAAFFAKVRRQYRELARHYHPDASGTDATRPHFEAATAAYQLLQQHERSLEAHVQDQKKENHNGTT
jgi:hypothetical protein